MSASTNPDAVANQGEFSSRIPPSKPMETGGHKPGVKASPADQAGEFSAQPLPAGTAPSSRTFQPNSTSEVPGQADNPLAQENPEPGTSSDPLDFPGATSADVHKGLGHPGQGQSSVEVRHDGQHGRKNEGAGIVGRGASGADANSKMVDTSVIDDQRGLERDVPQDQRGGDKGAVAAEDKMPEQIR